MTDRLCTFLQQALRILLIALCAGLLAANIAVSSCVSYNQAEISTVSPALMSGILSCAVVGVCVYLLRRNQSRLSTLRPMRLYTVFAVVYTLAALYLIQNVGSTLRADAGIVYGEAQKLLDPAAQVFFPGSYLTQYPHQLGLAAYDALVYYVFNNTRVLFYLNFLFVLGINYLLWRIAHCLFQSRRTDILTIVCSFAFLPQFFFILFAYGLIPGFFFMLTGYYAAVRFADRRQLRYLPLVALGLAGACFFKLNYAIAAVAAAIFFLLRLLRDRDWRHALAIAVAILSALLPGRVLCAGFAAVYDADLSNGAPPILHVAMGTDLDNVNMAPGWYNGTNHFLYADAQYNREKAAELGREKLEENWEEIRSDPARAFSFFTKKIATQWCEPLFQSVWSGPIQGWGQVTHTRLLASLYGGGVVEKPIRALSRAVVLAIWGFALLFLLRRHRSGELWPLFFLYTLGGFLFHIVWEAKSQYIYTYVFILIPFAMHALHGLLGSGEEAR